MPIDPRAHFLALAEHTGKLLSGFGQAVQGTNAGTDPIALDKFAIHCRALAEALSQTAERAAELAGTLLDSDAAPVQRRH